MESSGDINTKQIGADGRLAMTQGVFYASHQNAATAHTRVGLAKIRAVVSSMRIGMALCCIRNLYAYARMVAVPTN